MLGIPEREQGRSPAFMSEKPPSMLPVAPCIEPSTGFSVAAVQGAALGGGDTALGEGEGGGVAAIHGMAPALGCDTGCFDRGKTLVRPKNPMATIVTTTPTRMADRNVLLG
jgi:hypothetical protein